MLLMKCRPLRRVEFSLVEQPLQIRNAFAGENALVLFALEDGERYRQVRRVLSHNLRYALRR